MSGIEVVAELVSALLQLCQTCSMRLTPNNRMPDDGSEV